MDFTREPVVECVITPKEGSKLVVRSSKGSSQEEYFVDSVEVVSFGNAFFFRTLEKPKSFLLPSSDYEVLEVREARMVLKHTSGERSAKALKIKPQEKKKEPEKKPPAPVVEEKKPERRRQTRRRKLTLNEESSKDSAKNSEENKIELPEPLQVENPAIDSPEQKKKLRAILPPPPSLISETIGKYRDDEMFKSAFFAGDNEEEETILPAKTEEAVFPAKTEEAVVAQNSEEESKETKSAPEGEAEPKKRSFWDFAKELTNNK